MANINNDSNKTNLIHVAKELGVSISTVSRVVSNSKHPVSAELREKVLQKVKEMNYTTNLIGKQLKLNNSFEIGVIVPSLTNPFYPLLLQGLESTARKSGYFVLLCNSLRDAEIENDCLNLLYRKRVAGVVISSISQKHDILEKFIDEGIPVVTFDQVLDNLKCSKIYMDVYDVGVKAVEHLLKLGHRKIGFVSSPLDRYTRRTKYEAYKACLYLNHIDVRDDYIRIAKKEEEKDVYEYEEAKALTEGLLDLDDPPTAIIAENDILAYGVITKIRQRGINIPEEISVIGINNLMTSDIIEPPLTTFRQPTREMGIKSAEIIIDKIEKRLIKNIEIKFGFELVQRKSTGIVKQK